MVLAWVCCVTSAQAANPEPSKVSRPGVYSGYSPVRYSESIKTSQYVTVRDGTRLAVDIYRPAIDGHAVDERFPVVWVHTP
jgi:predicted acyl esterase